MKTHSKLLLLLILPILFLTFSCSKDGGNIKVEGTVVDKYTGQAVPDAMVEIIRRNGDFNLVGGSGGTLVASKKSDANGKFSFSFYFNNEFPHDIYAEKENYYDNGNSPVSIPSKGATDLKIPMEAEAYLKIHIFNTSPFDSYDTLRYSGDWAGSLEQHIGTKISKTILHKVTGNNNINIHWIVIKNKIKNSYKYSIFCPAFDTTLYEIKY